MFVIYLVDRTLYRRLVVTGTFERCVFKKTLYKSKNQENCKIVNS